MVRIAGIDGCERLGGGRLDIRDGAPGQPKERVRHGPELFRVDQAGGGQRVCRRFLDAGVRARGEPQQSIDCKLAQIGTALRERGQPVRNGLANFSSGWEAIIAWAAAGGQPQQRYDSALAMHRTARRDLSQRLSSRNLDVYLAGGQDFPERVDDGCALPGIGRIERREPDGGRLSGFSGLARNKLEQRVDNGLAPLGIVLRRLGQRRRGRLRFAGTEALREHFENGVDRRLALVPIAPGDGGQRCHDGILEIVASAAGGQLRERVDHGLALVGIGRAEGTQRCRGGGLHVGAGAQHELNECVRRRPAQIKIARVDRRERLRGGARNARVGTGG